MPTLKGDEYTTKCIECGKRFIVRNYATGTRKITCFTCRTNQKFQLYLLHQQTTGKQMTSKEFIAKFKEADEDQEAL